MKRITKLTALFAALCMTAVLICSCAKVNVTISATEIYGKVTEAGQGSITIEVGTYGASLKGADNSQSGTFPGFGQGFGSGQTPPEIGDGQTPPDIDDGQTPPEIGNGQTPPEIGDGQPLPDASDKLDENNTSTDAKEGFTEQDNKESGFGSIGGNRIESIFGGADNFTGSGVSLKLAIAGGATITDARGNDTEVKVGDVVKLTLNGSQEVTAITILSGSSQDSSKKENSGRNNDDTTDSDNTGSRKNKKNNDTSESDNAGRRNDDTSDSDNAGKKKNGKG